MDMVARASSTRHFMHLISSKHTSWQIQGTLTTRLLMCSAARVDSSNGRINIGRSSRAKQLMMIGMISFRAGRNAFSLSTMLPIFASPMTSSLVNAWYTIQNRSALRAISNWCSGTIGIGLTAVNWRMACWQYTSKSSRWLFRSVAT